LMRAGRIKVLLVTSKQRALGAPELPTAAEAGYPALTTLAERILKFAADGERNRERLRDAVLRDLAA